MIVANKKFTDGANRKKDKEKWNKVNESRSKVCKKEAKPLKSRNEQPVTINLSGA